MKKFNFLIGRRGSGRTDYIFEKMIGDINSPNTYYYIVPEQMTLEAEKKLLDLAKRPVFNIKIISFARLATEVLKRTGGMREEFLSPLGSLMALKHISLEENPFLKVYGNCYRKVGFLEKLKDTIVELKKSGQNSFSLFLNSKNIEPESLREKIDEIGYFLRGYEEFSSGKFIDNEDRLSLLKEKISKDKSLEGSIFYFDKFFSLDEIEYDILKQLIISDIEVNFSLDLDPDFLEGKRIRECFSLTKSTYDYLNNIAKSLGSETKNIIFDKPSHEREEISHLEEYYSASNPKVYLEKTDTISINESENMEKEAENLANFITNLVVKNGYAYRDIKVFAPKSGQYSKICERIFKKYGIPLYVDLKTSSSVLDISRFLFSFLDMMVEDFSINSVLSFLKSNLNSIQDENIFLIEKFLKKWNIRIVSHKITDEENREKFFYGYDGEEREKILKTIEYLREIKSSYKKRFPKKAKTSDYVDALKDFFEEIGISSAIKLEVKRLKDEGLYKEASLSVSSFNKILEVIEQLESILGENDMQLTDFIEILSLGISSQSIATIPPSKDQVVLSDIARTRYFKSKAAIFIGMTDSELPIPSGDCLLLTDEEVVELQNANIKLSSNLGSSLEHENISLYHLIGGASEYIHFSYPLIDAKGMSTKATIYLRQIEKMFKGAKKTSDVGETKKSPMPKEYAFEKLYQSLRDEKSSGEFEDDSLALAKKFYEEEEFKEKSMRYIDALFYKYKSKPLDRQKVSKIYSLPIIASASRIESYAKCPYRHFMDYGIRPEKNEDAKLEFLDIGNVLHSYMEKLSKEVISGEIHGEIDENYASKKIDEIFDEEGFLSERLEILKNCSKSFSYKFKKIKKIAKNSTLLALKQLENSEFKIRDTEYIIKPRKVKIGSTDEDIYNIAIVKGKVDRIDIMEVVGSRYVGIIDYKSSTREINVSDVLNAVNIQLPIYIYIISKEMDAKPACMLYFPMLDPKIDTSGDDKEEIANMLLEKNRLQGIILNDENVKKSIYGKNGEKFVRVIENKGNSKYYNLLNSEQLDLLANYAIEMVKKTCNKILDGNFEANPVEGECEYCRYKSICKFDPQIDGYSYKKITKIPTDQALKAMEEELEGKEF